MSETAIQERFIPVRKDTSLEDFRGGKSNVLVIAPHPDDDILGAGGTMAASSASGKKVFSVYMTDGRGSPRRDAGTTHGMIDEEFILQRQKEAQASLEKIGAVGGFHLKYLSGDLGGSARASAGQDLADILHFLVPREVFLPAPYERHATHQRCTTLAIDVLRAVPFKPALWGYSLWGCFWGGEKRVLQDITPHIRRKVDAVMAHSSQMAYKNYQQGIIGKNNYEAIFWEPHEPQKTAFAEIFLDMTALLEIRDLTIENFIRRDVESFLRLFGKSA